MSVNRTRYLGSSKNLKILLGLALIGISAIFSLEAYTVLAVETSIEVSPIEGLPGETVSVSGYGFTNIAGTGVSMTLNTTSPIYLGTATTLADGSFTTTFMVPAIAFTNYLVVATDDYGVNASADFEIGMHPSMNIIPIVGLVGTNVTLTGIDFPPSAVGHPPGTYNVTFGSERVVTNGAIEEDWTIDSWFIVPTVGPGIYDVTVEDSWGNELSLTFTVPPDFAIPEYPMGTISAIAVSLISLLLVSKRQRISLHT